MKLLPSPCEAFSEEEIQKEGLIFYAYRDENEWWRLRKVVLEVGYICGDICYRRRYLTTLFPKLKYLYACRRIRRLWKMEGGC